MKEKLNIQKHPVVNIETGEVYQWSVVRLHRTPSDSKGYLRAWTSGNLRKDGQPDSRVRGTPVGVSVSTYNGELSGRYAFPLDGVKGAQADEARASIRRLQNELHAAQQHLLGLYQGQEEPL